MESVTNEYLLVGGLYWTWNSLATQHSNMPPLQLVQATASWQPGDEGPEFPPVTPLHPLGWQFCC